jgi:hypothetical protein
MGKIVRAGAGAGIFDKLEPELEPHKNRPAPHHWLQLPPPQQKVTYLNHVLPMSRDFYM